MTTTRPTCGTCPHSVEVFNQLGVEVMRCAVLPLPQRAHDNREANEFTPGCIHHPAMPAYIAGLSGNGDALREAVLATVPAMVDHLSAIERREGSNLSVSAVHSLDSCQDQLQALVDLAAKETP